MRDTRIQYVPEKAIQVCPLCGERQTTMMRGLSHDLETNEIVVVADRGYSFCNCRNIFFTDWKNIDQTIYDDVYHFKYQCVDTKNVATGEATKFLKIIRHIDFGRFKPKTFVEVGSIHDYVLDYMSQEGLIVQGLDIVNRPSKHNFTSVNMEKLNLRALLGSSNDIVWASHIIEHLKDPKAGIENLRDCLSKDGILYIAMPDTWYIDFDNNNPLKWDWVVNEHHILWNMDNFIEFAEELGLTCIHKERSIDLVKRERGDYFWKQDFKTLFKLS